MQLDYIAKPDVLDILSQMTLEKIDPQHDFIKDLDEVLTGLRDLLIAKNRKYGDSALSPVRLFSKSSAKEQLLVRLDDKVSRIANQKDTEDEDVFVDTTGYLILYLIAALRESRVN